MKKLLLMIIVSCFITLNIFAQKNVLFLIGGGSATKIESIMADSMETWGYTVTTTFSAPSATSDYAAFNIVVISEFISSGDVKGYATAGYPLPIVNCEGYSPRNNRWGWLSSDQQIPSGGDQSSGYWFQITSEDTEVANRPIEDYAYISVKNGDHDIWKAMDKYTDEEVRWTTTDSIGTLEVVWMDLEGAGVITSGMTVLADYKSSNKPALMAIEKGTTVNTLGIDPVGSITTDHRIMLSGLKYDAFRDFTNDSSLAFVTQDYWNLLHYSIMWVNEEDLSIYFEPKLKQIYIDSVPLQNFHTDTTLYYYGVGTCHDSTIVPDVSVTPFHPSLSINIDTADHSYDTTFITVSSGGNQRIYTIIFNKLTDTVATLNAVKAGDEFISDFNSYTFEYSIDYPYGSDTSDLKNIRVFLKDECGSYEIDTAEAPGDTTIIDVHSSDKLTTYTYLVIHNVLPPSNIATLQDISLNGNTIVNFNPNTYSYLKVLPYGTTTLPSLTYTRSDKLSTVIYDPASSLNDTAFITVTAEDGLTTNTYLIIFQLSSFNPSKNVLFLISGSIGTQTFEDMMASKMESWGHTVTTVVSTPIIPADYAGFDVIVVSEAISASNVNNFATAGYPLPIVNMEGYAPRNNKWGWLSSDQQIPAGGDQSGGYWFQVTNEDTEEANRPIEDYAFIAVKNENHDIWKAMGKSADEEVQWSTTDSAGSLEIVWMDLEGAGIITDGITVLANYKTLNKPALMAIEKGTTVNTLGTDPVGSFTADHRIIQSGFIIDGFITYSTDTAFITQDYWNILKYSILWVTESMNVKIDDASLANIKINGTTIDGFDPSTFEYTYVLNFGDSIIPGITIQTSQKYATYTIDTAQYVNDTTFIKVTAEDGITTSVYSIIFEAGSPSNDAHLSDIRANGSSIDGFASDSLGCYIVFVPEGDDIPTITCTPDDPHSSYEIIPADSIGDKTYIIATAEDSTTSLTYCIEFRLLVNIENVISELANLFPTYVSTELNIELNDETLINGTVIISSITGKHMINRNLESDFTAINCSGLTSGMYFVTIIKDNKMYSAKIIKE